MTVPSDQQESLPEAPGPVVPRGQVVHRIAPAPKASRSRSPRFRLARSLLPASRGHGWKGYGPAHPQPLTLSTLWLSSQPSLTRAYRSRYSRGASGLPPDPSRRYHWKQRLAYLTGYLVHPRKSLRSSKSVFMGRPTGGRRAEKASEEKRSLDISLIRQKKA